MIFVIGNGTSRKNVNLSPKFYGACFEDGGFGRYARIGY